MSSNIWTRCGAKSNVKRLTVTARRVVEGQHRISTRQLVDSDDEHDTLEQILEATKPPTEPATPGLHYLLATPFRYPPLRHGSRFGRRHERGIWYGSKTLKTVFAEKAYYELYFVSGSAAALTPLRKDLTTYATSLRSRHGVDLTQGPFAAELAAIASPVSYAATHALGTAMRDDGVELVIFPSARDPDHGDNVAAFTPAVFSRATPSEERGWSCHVDDVAVEIRESSLLTQAPDTYRFERSLFTIDGAIPIPSA